MHILYLSPCNTIHSQRFLQMLLDQGYIVTLLGYDDLKPEGALRYQFIPFPTIDFNLPCVHWRLESMLRRLESTVKRRFLLAKLRHLWLRIKPDVVNVHLVDDRAYYCARAGLHPLVLSCWGTEINSLFGSENQDRTYRQRIALALSAAAYLTADSREVLDHCERLVGRKLSTRLFHFGVDTEVFKPAYIQEAQALRHKLKILPNSKVILSCRRLNPTLGQHYILRAFNKVVQDLKNPDIVLVFKRYLAHKGTEDKLKLEATKLGVDHKIYWLDESPHHELPVHYAMADVVVNYAECDAFPVTLFEAAACKRPVITSNLPAYEGVFENSFLTVPPCNVHALAEALRNNLTEKPEEAQQRIEKAYAIAIEKGDQKKNFQIMFDIFSAVKS